MLYLMQVSTENAVLGRKIAELRRAHGWSQAQLARSLETVLHRTMDPTAITRMEKGQRPFLVHELVELARLFGIEPADLLTSLSPIDTARRTAGTHADLLLSRLKRARSDYLEAQRHDERLRWLQQYKVTQASADLARGLAFLTTIAELERRRDWREILLDAGVPAPAISAALKRAKVSDAYADDETGETVFRFVQSLRHVLGLPDEHEVTD